MKIRTAQDANLIGCCGCPMTLCDPPRTECQSIDTDACGYSLPQVDGMPRTDFCLMFKTMTSTQSRSLNVSTSGVGVPTYSYSNSETNITVTKISPDDGGCVDAVFSTSHDYSLSESSTPYGSDDPTYDYSIHEVGTSGTSGVCSGTLTYTDNVDPGENYTAPASCVNVATYPDSSWTYLGTGIYQRDDSIGSGYDSLTTTTVFSDPVTGADLAAMLTSMIEALEPEEDWPGTACTSTVESSKTFTIQDPPAPPAEVDPEFVPVEVCSQVSSAVKARYKIGTPIGWADFDGRHAAWVIDHAAWVVADPDTRGPEPIEPVERSVYECEWDEVFFPAPWEAWKLLKEAFDAATLAYEEWEACEEDCGEAPEIPEDPGAEPSPAPSLVTVRSWIYAGGAAEFSEWFEIDVPESEGETRIVNMMVICYHDTRRGVKPTAHGEVYELPE